MLRRADADNRQRLHDEFNIYLTLEKAYHNLVNHMIVSLLAPMVHSKAMAWPLILDSCDGVLNEWRELTDFER